MFGRILLVIGLWQFVPIEAANCSTNTYNKQQIANELLKNVPVQVQGLWRISPSNENIYYSPLLAEVALQLKRIKTYYENVSGEFHPKDKCSYLKKPYALASILDEMQNSNNTKLNFITIVQYDPRKALQELLYDLKTYYHAETYAVPFDSNLAILATLNYWLSKNTKRRAPRIEFFSRAGTYHLPSSLMLLKSCWNTPKPLVKSLKFNTPDGQIINIETFNSKEKIGYYKNTEQKYEAVRIPYKNGEFSMILVLPDQNQSLESISQFIDNDHRELLQRVNEKYENIDFAIPFMNLTMLSVNENGTATNGDETIICDWTSAARKSQNMHRINYKPFYLNRPFAMYIYHQKTKFVLIYGLVRNPALGILQYRTLKFKFLPFD